MTPDATKAKAEGWTAPDDANNEYPAMVFLDGDSEEYPVAITAYRAKVTLTITQARQTAHNLMAAADAAEQGVSDG